MPQNKCKLLLLGNFRLFRLLQLWRVEETLHSFKSAELVENVWNDQPVDHLMSGNGSNTKELLEIANKVFIFFYRIDQYILLPVQSNEPWNSQQHTNGSIYVLIIIRIYCKFKILFSSLQPISMTTTAHCSGTQKCLHLDRWTAHDRLRRV